ncbi:hypothetical protein HXX76_007120 [Chlamydomonas incerta]|uniref:Uncharacterized protein n=1 Tax=Chlamydomonas incerta TaxID=51695 RepID=A0A835W1K5_CHLIN|nr:hypothetical protein HXX76_007120 [Chlamydomonas incerta]|eukprot:KAG2435925.1 hypothetical protein HXX76_007120 [Chlamydomonas incerta]
MQQELQKIQQEVSAYRDECKALEADSRLHDTVSIKQSLDSETAALRQTLQSLHQAAVAEDEALMGFRERVMVLLRSTESAIRLYQRSKLWRELSAAAGQPGGAGGGAAAQLLASQAVADQISQPVQLPNPYLGLAVRGFSEALEQYHRCISELERVMAAAGGAGLGGFGGAGIGLGGGGDDSAAVAALPTLVSHMHDYFVHVAARLERLHGEVGRAREAYLAARRARGDYGDPFADARPLHHMSKSGVNPPKSAQTGGANNGGGTFYSFGGPASNAHGASGLGAVGGIGAGGGGGTAPGTPGAGGAGAGGGAAASGGGMFGMSPGPLGGASASPFGAPGMGGAFGTPLLGAASAQQPQQQRVSAGRAGSSSNKKR